MHVCVCVCVFVFVCAFLCVAVVVICIVMHGSVIYVCGHRNTRGDNVRAEYDRRQEVRNYYANKKAEVARYLVPSLPCENLTHFSTISADTHIH